MGSPQRDAAIVGVYEYPLRKVGDDVNALRIKAECAIRALEDAGLTWKDVDAIYECGEEGTVHAAVPSTPEYFGIQAGVTDTTMTGGSSFEFQEALGFCAIGEAGDFIDKGWRIGPGGELPLNPHGGQLAEGRLHGLRHLVEVVLQLRGEAGDRQVADARGAVVSNGHGPQCGALVLRTE